MPTENYDLVVIGGGINGVGVAQAAAAQGYRCLLLEKNPRLAMETSSCSSKLIHGGLRYLESLELSLVRESLKERELLLRLAPELVRLQAFNIPIYEDTSRSTLHLRAGLSLYALLSGLHKHSLYRRIQPELPGVQDGLKLNRLKAVFQYFDAQTDDVALTLAVMASAVRLGAEYECDAEFIHADIVNGESSQGRVSIRYTKNGCTETIVARTLVNAAGPWVMAVNRCIFPSLLLPEPDLVQGTHLILQRALKQAYYLEAPVDRRAVFLLPWKSHALLGTTEHIYRGKPENIHMLSEEKKYLLDVYRHYFTDDSDVSAEDMVLDNMTGCRVLPAAESGLFKRSRETHFEVDNILCPRVLTIVGGKLTVYRKTAEKVLQRLACSLPSVKARADTSRLILSPASSKFV